MTDHGLIGVSSSLELEISIGISWEWLGVFTDGPFLSWSIHLLCGVFFIFVSGYTWRNREVLGQEMATAASGRQKPEKQL